MQDNKRKNTHTLDTHEFCVLCDPFSEHQTRSVTYEGTIVM